MSVLVKGMKMPRGCLECMFKDIGTYGMTQCLLVAGWVEYAGDGYEIPEACPLVEIPPHGGLIDADELLKKMNLAISMMSGMMKALGAEDDAELKMELKSYRDIRDGIKEEPTIIEAEMEADE